MHWRRSRPAVFGTASSMWPFSLPTNQTRLRDCMLLVIESTVDAIQGELWPPNQVCKELSCFEYADGVDWCYDGNGQYRGQWNLLTGYWCLPSFDKPWRFESDSSQRLELPRRSEPKGFRTALWVWRFMSFNMPSIAKLPALPDDWKEGSRRARPPRRSHYSGIIYFCWTWLHAAWRMRMVGPPQSTVACILHFFESWN